MNRVAVGLLAGAVTSAAAVLLRERPPGGAARWRRRNFRDREVDLLGGVATATGTVVGALAAGGAPGGAAALVSATGAVLGAIDDADTTSQSKGLRGHITALSRGDLTTGMLKLVGISSASLVAAGVATGFGRRSADGGALGRAADVVTSGVLIAGTANLVNLFDLRPGRALKIVGVICAPLATVPGATGRVAAAGLGAVAASWEGDLGEETMLGDAGANALGAVAGTALALVPVARARHLATAAAVGLVLLSEKVSFSQLIATTPWLKRLDDWQRAE